MAQEHDVASVGTDLGEERGGVGRGWGTSFTGEMSYFEHVLLSAQVTHTCTCTHIHTHTHAGKRKGVRTIPLYYTIYIKRGVTSS